MGAKWRATGCERCNGYGVVGYGLDQIADECADCNGSGRLWISPRGRIAAYPGAPFLGRATETESANADKALREMRTP